MGRVRRKLRACRTSDRWTNETSLATDVGSGGVLSTVDVSDPDFVESYQRMLAAEGTRPDLVNVRNFEIVSPTGAVLAAGIGVSALLIALAVPRFAELYEAFGLTLPLLTRALIAASAWFASGWWWIGLAVLAYVCVRVTRRVRDSSAAKIVTGLALLVLMYSLFVPV